MDLFGVRIGLGDGENQIENKVGFVTVAVVGNGDGRIVAENGDAVRKWIEVNIVEMGANECDGGVNVSGWDGDADGPCRRDAVGDCCKDGEFHGNRMRRKRGGVKGNFEKF